MSLTRRGWELKIVFIAAAKLWAAAHAFVHKPCNFCGAIHEAATRAMTFHKELFTLTHALILTIRYDAAVNFKTVLIRQMRRQPAFFMRTTVVTTIVVHRDRVVATLFFAARYDPTLYVETFV